MSKSDWNPSPEAAAALLVAGITPAKNKIEALRLILWGIIPDASAEARAVAEVYLGRPVKTPANLPRHPESPLKGRGARRVKIPRDWGTSAVIEGIPTHHRADLAGGLSGGWVKDGPRIISPEAYAMVKPALDWLGVKCTVENLSP